MNEKTMVKDLTQGSIAKTLINYAAPILLANTLQAVYNLVDMMVMGQVEGGVGMAAVSIGGEIVQLATFLLIGFTVAGQIILAQLVGAQKKESIKRMIGTIFVVTIIMAVCMLAICLIFGNTFLRLLNADPLAAPLAKTYYLTCICGIFFIAGYNMVCAVLRGMGDSRRPLYFVAIASVLNTVLDILFVAVFHWSAFGAALATVIGQSVSFFVALTYLYRHRESFGFDFKLSSFRVYKEELVPLIKLGIPMSIQMASVTGSKAVLAAWINSSGYAYSALNGIFSKLGMFMGVISSSFSTAGGASVAQCIGAKKYERVPKIMGMVFLITGIICGTVSLLVYLFPEFVFELFTRDMSVIEISGVLVVPVVICMMGGVGRSVGFSLVNGSGNSKLNLIVALFDGIVARIGFSYVMGFLLNMSVRGFWLGDALAGYMPFAVGIAFYFTGRWKDNSRLIKDNKTV
jgi:putative MATE family efflux protein